LTERPEGLATVGFGGFRPAAFRFLKDLARHNEKAWFEAHRAVYERELRDPMRRLVETLDIRLGAIAPEIVGDPRRSMFRIHRDIRFSHDKSPYKTNAGAWLYHRDAGRKVGREGEGGGAGFYFHIDPATCFVAGGIWMPARPALQRIRAAIAADPAALARLTRAPGFRRRFAGLSEEAKLRRVPRDFAPDHPAAEFLKLQSFTARAALEPRAVTNPRLVDLLCGDFALLATSRRTRGGEGARRRGSPQRARRRGAGADVAALRRDRVTNSRSLGATRRPPLVRNPVPTITSPLARSRTTGASGRLSNSQRAPHTRSDITTMPSARPFSVRTYSS
jgi:uncharacterized protein (TIGR02453 family)